MPGFLGGSTSGSGTGGEITFPKEFIDPVTKLRVSQPETLIDTDFEYGLQPTKWETLELINNTPSFFSKSGDTTIPNIISITTNAGTREITVTTALDHGLAIGVPINVQGTKSITADGSYIIASIPSTTTFTYLCKDTQPTTASIEDLYTSIITGEFFQGSQIRISDSEGIITDGQSVSTLTVKTESNHGFGVNTPFYFLNLNSTVSQEFESANTASKSFDSSNSATAQTFDGSNTLTQIQIDLSNSAVIGGTASSIVSVDTVNDTITVTHTTETFVGSQLGTPLYYDVTTSAGYFSTNPRGVVFLKTTDQLASGTSIFQVSEVPDGTAISIEAAMTGTFQLANQARVFAGNNVDPTTQIELNLLEEESRDVDAANELGSSGTVTSFSGSLVNVDSDSGDPDLNWYPGAMVFYTSTGSAASGLTNNTTYFVDTFFQQGSTSSYSFTLKEQPDSANAIASISGGTGTQVFTQIGVSLDKDWVHVPGHQATVGDMFRYDYPVAGRWTTTEPDTDYYYVETVGDNYNLKFTNTRLLPLQDVTYSYTGSAQTFVVPSGVNRIKAYVWGAAGGAGITGRGGAGGYAEGIINVTPGETLYVIVGQGGETRGMGQQSNGAGGGVTGIYEVWNTGNIAATHAGTIIAAGAGGGGGASLGDGGCGGGNTGGAILSSHRPGRQDGPGIYPGNSGGTQTGNGSGNYMRGGVGCGGAQEANESGWPNEAFGGGIWAAPAGGNGCNAAGGGGGYYGASGGTDLNSNGGSAGGGSGYIGGTGSHPVTQGVNSISSQNGGATNPPNTGNEFYTAGVGVSPAANSTVGARGGHGQVTIQYGGVI